MNTAQPSLPAESPNGGRQVGGRDYGKLVAAARGLLDAISQADAPDALVAAAVEDIRRTDASLRAYALDHEAAPAGQRLDLPGRGHPLLMPLIVDQMDSHHMQGRVTFSRTHMGAGGVAHGGFLPLLFDEVLGVFPYGMKPYPRTAFLHVDYRQPTPLEVELTVEARLLNIDGRKVSVVGWLRHGDALLAEAEALFVQPRG